MVANVVIHVSHGAFLYPAEWVGMFLPLAAPAITPTVEYIEQIEKRGRS
jgi:hypothetical protein